MEAHALEGGFSNPALEAADAFRAVMEAMARPGTPFEVKDAVTPPAPLSRAAGTVVLTLCDATTPLHLAEGYDNPDVRAWIAFHTGAPIATAEDCQFALGTWEALMPLARFHMGEAAYPDRSATLIVEDEGAAGVDVTLRGPGIAQTASATLPEAEAFQANRARYPLGLDFIFTKGSQIMGLPRSTEVS